MKQEIRIHAPKVQQGLGFGASGDFPATPGLNTIWPHEDGQGNNTLFIYTKIDNVETWFPMIRGIEQAVYVHTQGVASDTWNIEHNLGSNDIWWQVRDSDGGYILAPVGHDDTVDPLNKFTLKFAEPIRGRVVVVAAKAFSTPRLKTSLISIGELEINSNGFKYQGNQLSMGDLANAGNASAAAAAAQAAADKAQADIVSLGKTVNQVSIAANTAESDAQTAIANAANALAAAQSAKTTADANTTAISDVNALVAGKADKTGVSNTFAVKAGVMDGEAVNVKQLHDAIAGLVGTAPAALDTLGEIAAQLANDESVTASLVSQLANKADKTGVTGTFTVGNGVGNNDAVNVGQLNTAVTALQTQMSLAENPQTGASYHPVASDFQYPGSGGKLLAMNSATAQSIVIDPASTLNVPVGATLTVSQEGAGKVTVVGGTGVTILSAGNYLSIGSQYGVITLIKRAANTWLLAGLTGS